MSVGILVVGANPAVPFFRPRETDGQSGVGNPSASPRCEPCCVTVTSVRAIMASKTVWQLQNLGAA